MANFNINKVILGGRLTADPEIKQTPSGVAVTSFILAVNRRHQEKDAQQTQADFITVTAWRGTAEFICRYFRKGSSLCVVGEIRTRTWTDPQGQKRYATEVNADEAYFVDAKGEGGTAANAGTAVPPASQYVPEQYTAAGGANFAELGDNEELPF